MNVGDLERLRKLGVTLRSLRTAHGLSQAVVARTVGVDVKTISRIEKAKMIPNLGIIWRLSEALGHSVSEILGEPAAMRTLEASPLVVQGEAPLPADARLAQIEAELRETRELLKQIEPQMRRLVSAAAPRKKGSHSA